ncbi:MAG TPA: hypothetical protein VMT85_16040 [Thermoanaerobaculia bacterium]|nr:hypothetical protein [Thermoanaerobaculia bacterium]
MCTPRSLGRRPGAALVLLAAVWAGGAAAQAPELLRLDRSDGSSAGIVWLVASSADAEAQDRFAGVGLARLADVPLERSFALRAGAGDPELGSAGERVSDLVGSGRTVIEVTVAPRAYDEVRHLVARWQEGEQEGTAPPARIENLLDRVARTIGLKTPYRSVLRGAEPVAYLRDLARINGGG